MIEKSTRRPSKSARSKLTKLTKSTKSTKLTPSKSSRKSIQTCAFGPPLWAYLHMLAMSYPVEPSHAERLLFARTIMSILKTLPCNLCVGNADKKLDCLGFTGKHTAARLSQTKFLSSRARLTKFMFDLHNHVNACLGKPIKRNYQQFVNEMNHVYASNKEHNNPIKCQTCVMFTKSHHTN
jgi:hypothetical protein